MSKIIDATCSASGVVTADGVTVQSAEVLSEGTKASSGLLFVEAEKARYLPSNATDIKDLITNLVGIIDQISVIVTTLDGVTTSPGSAAAAIATLGTLKTQLNQSKETLK